jgi:hypothetical protein
MDVRELRVELEADLESLRNSYKVFRQPPRLGHPLKDRRKHMQEIQEQAERVKRDLTVVPAMPLLCELKLTSEDEALRMLKVLIVDMVLFHETSDKMSKEMIEETALRILYQFGGLTVEDVALCFHQVKNGLRGTVYNRVDAQVLMKWLHDYQKDAQEVGMERNLRIHNNDKTGVWKVGHEYRITDINRQSEFDYKGWLDKKSKEGNIREEKRIKDLMK